MAARGTGLPLNSPEWGGSGPDGEAAAEVPEADGAWPQLEPAEIQRRLDATIRELGNRRKILVRNLPHDCSSQDIHHLLKDYEIKYCYVDKNKKTAFITLTNGEQAQDAISRFHKHVFRDKEIWVQLQPTDALLCVTNLPPSFTLQEFEDLVRTYGNIERCILVYSELSGHFKGYGFVEYMKKDSASKARLELLGKQLEEYTLFAQWVDVNQLTADFIHSKCLCVDKLPKDYSNTEELTEMFSSLHNPLFCQLAEDESGDSGGFAVVEYDTAMQAEDVRDFMDGAIVNGSRIQVSFCAPGSPGRSVLAALIAAQGMLQNNRKGLLPEPNPAQIIQSLSNPAMLQMLLQPPHRGRSGNHGSSGRPHFVNPTVSQALLQLNNLHQPGLPGNVLLQNYPHLQMAQQQLLQLKSPQSNNSKPGLLGEAPVSMLPTAMGTAQTGSVEAAPRDLPKSLLPYYHNQHSTLPRLPQDKQPALMASEGSLLPGPNPAHIQAGTADALHGNKMSSQTSLLGEPPRDIRLSTNPYLNLASVLPGMTIRALQSHTMDGLISQDSAAQPALDGYFTYSQQYGDYSSQEALQQWYDQYSTYSGAQNDAPGDSSQSSSSLGYGDYSSYVQAPPTYYASAQTLYQPGVTASAEKVTGGEKRSYILSSPDAGPGYSEHYGQASGDGDVYFKRKKVF